ncbi:hypothetical protein NHX12_003228, partial [Muraenolepis orangiensis]
AACSQSPGRRLRKTQLQQALLDGAQLGLAVGPPFCTLPSSLLLVLVQGQALR